MTTTLSSARLDFLAAYRLRRLVACVPVDACASLAVWAADCAYADRRAGDPLACPLSRRRTTASLTCAAARELFSFNRIRDQWRCRDLGLPWTQYSGERPAAAPLGFPPAAGPAAPAPAGLPVPAAAPALPAPVQPDPCPEVDRLACALFDALPAVSAARLDFLAVYRLRRLRARVPLRTDSRAPRAIFAADCAVADAHRPERYAVPARVRRGARALAVGLGCGLLPPRPRLPFGGAR